MTRTVLLEIMFDEDMHPIKVSNLGGSLTPVEETTAQEYLSQSDFGTIDFNAGIIDALQYGTQVTF